MASRLIPILLAGGLGIGIGVATFGSEFETQQKKRLEEEYRRFAAPVKPNLLQAILIPDSDLEAAAARGENVTEQLKALSRTPQEKKPDTKVNEESQPQTLGNALGFWAWNKGSSEGNSGKNA